MWVRLKAALSEEDVPLTHAGVLGQVWRGGSHQARLAQVLPALDIRALDHALGRAAGELLGTTGRSDVIDAALVLLSSDGDDIVTSDLPDLEPLAAASGRHVELIRP
jgi:hypothetical protein